MSGSFLSRACDINWHPAACRMARKRTTMSLRSFLVALAPLLLLAAHGVHARLLQTAPSNSFSDGTLRMWGQGSAFSGDEGSGCEETYGFLPCTNSALGNLFLLLVYGYLMFFAASCMSEGSEMLLEVLGPGIIGGLFLPALGALPDAILILVSGLSGSRETAQEQVLIGMGLLAGSTVMLLTVLWGSCVVLGKCDLSPTAADGVDTRKFSLTGSGVTSDLQTVYSARIMIISVFPFIIVQLPKIFPWSSGNRLTVLIALFASIGLLISYCVYQIVQPWIQKRRLEYAKEKHIRANVLTGIVHKLQKHYLGRLLDKNGIPNREAIDKVFDIIDTDKDETLSLNELTAFVNGIMLDENLDGPEAAEKVLNDFDVSHDGNIDKDEFYKGMCSWLDQATACISDSKNFSTNFFNEYRQVSLQEHSSLEEANGEVSESEEKKNWVTLKAVSLLLLGAGIAVMFADPLVDAVGNFSAATSIPSFFISFIAMPLATNSSEAVSAIIFASRKTQKTASLTFSEIYGAVTMNNTLCLSVFLGLVYVRNLTWDFSSEVLIIMLVCIAMGLVASYRSTYPLWTSFIAFLLYPASLILVYVLDFVYGWS